MCSSSLSLCCSWNHSIVHWVFSTDICLWHTTTLWPNVIIQHQNQRPDFFLSDWLAWAADSHSTTQTLQISSTPALLLHFITKLQWINKCRTSIHVSAHWSAKQLLPNTICDILLASKQNIFSWSAGSPCIVSQISASTFPFLSFLLIRGPLHGCSSNGNGVFLECMTNLIYALLCYNFAHLLVLFE